MQKHFSGELEKFSAPEKLDWLELKTMNSPKLSKKNIFEHTSRKVGFCEKDPAKVDELCNQGYEHVLLLNRHNVPQMKTIKGTQTFHEVKSGEATNVEGEYKLHVSKIVCSCRKCRDPTLANLVCPVGVFAV